jgi:ABC-type proline/glycine betaine transport system permease subunit
MAAIAIECCKPLNGSSPRCRFPIANERKMQIQTGCASGKTAWGRPTGAAFSFATASSLFMTSPKNIMNVFSAAPWLGPSQSIYAMSLAISLFVTILVIYSGFKGVEVNQIKLARTFGASKAQILTKVILPGSIPTMIAALKVNAGLSLVGVVVGEFQSASVGLGYLIRYGSQIFRLDIVMTAVTVLAVVSSLIYGAIVWAERFVTRRR